MNLEKTLPKLWETVELQKENFLEKTGGIITGDLRISGNLTVENDILANSSSATKLQSAKTINGTSFDGTSNITTSKWGTARYLQVGWSSKAVDGSGNTTWSLSEIGAVSTDDYSLTTISKTLTLTTSWMDTGIYGSYIPLTGSYIVQISGMSSSATATWSEIWTGVMSWYSGTTNSTDADEIVLHKAGHASNGRTIYLRTLRSSGGQTLKLQIRASTNFSSTNITFKFRKII